MTDTETIADVIAASVRAAMAGYMADVKVVQSQIAGWEARWGDLGALRERVAVVEATQGLPVPVASEMRQMAPDEAAGLMARMTALEAQHGETAVSMGTMDATMSTMGDEMDACETDMATCMARLDALEAEETDDAATEAALVDIRTRLADVVARAPVPGPPGEPGPRGERGEAGVIDERVVAGLTDRIGLVDAKLAALEARGADLSPDEVAAAMTDLLRKELAIEPLRMQKRVVRDSAGKVERVVEELA